MVTIHVPVYSDSTAVGWCFRPRATVLLFRVLSVRRALARYDADCLGRYRNFVLWRAVKDGTGFHDAVLRQHADLVHPNRHAALACRQHKLVDSTIHGIPITVGLACAIISLQSCEELMPALESYFVGVLIASAVTVMLEASMDHVVGSMDDKIDDFKNTQEFKDLIAIEEFAGLNPDDAMEPITPSATVENPINETVVDTFES